MLKVTYMKGKYMENIQQLAKSYTGVQVYYYKKRATLVFAACPLCLIVRCCGGLLGRTFPFPVLLGSQPILLRLLGGKAYSLQSVAVLFEDLNMNALHEGGRDERSVRLVHGGSSGLELGYLVADLAHGLPRTLGMIWLPLEGWCWVPLEDSSIALRT